MTAKPTMYEINHQAIKVLCQEIGIVNTLRFIHQFTNGYGNYTEERRELFKGETVKSITAQIKALISK